MKKIISLLAALCLLITGSITCFADQDSNETSDFLNYNVKNETIADDYYVEIMTYTSKENEEIRIESYVNHDMLIKVIVYENGVQTFNQASSCEPNPFKFNKQARTSYPIVVPYQFTGSYSTTKLIDAITEPIFIAILASWAGAPAASFKISGGTAFARVIGMAKELGQKTLYMAMDKYTGVTQKSEWDVTYNMKYYHYDYFMVNGRREVVYAGYNYFDSTSPL